MDSSWLEVGVTLVDTEVLLVDSEVLGIVVVLSVEEV